MIVDAFGKWPVKASQVGVSGKRVSGAGIVWRRVCAFD